MNPFTASCSSPPVWNHDTGSEPAWLIRLAAESEAFHQAAICLVCLVAIAIVGGFFWVSSLSTQK